MMQKSTKVLKIIKALKPVKAPPSVKALKTIKDMPEDLLQFKTILGENSKIFDDEKLNKLIINSLRRYDEINIIDEINIVNAIVYVYDNNLCHVNDIWYRFNGIVWQKCHDFSKEILQQFSKLYDKVKYYIHESKIISENIKEKELEKISRTKNSIYTNKNIIATLEIELDKKNIFDLDNDLFAFNNTIYDFEQMATRCGVGSDMIKKSCKYDYSPKYINKQNLLNMLSDMFPDVEIMNFFILYIARAMCGRPDTDLLLFLHCQNDRYKSKLLHLITTTLGEYCCRVDALSSIISDQHKKYSDLLYLENVRFVIVDSVKRISHSDIFQLIDDKCIKSTHNGDQKINVNFSVLCMCDDVPILDDESFTQNIAYITSSDKKYESSIINKGDFFLLLVEYLEQFDSGKIMINRDCLKLDIQSPEEQICSNFMRNCIKKSTDREKCNDVYDKYVEWSTDKNAETLLTKIKLFAELKKHMTYNKSVRFGDLVTSAFTGSTIIRNNRLSNSNTYERIKKEKVPCIGINNICPYEHNGTRKYDGYCANCFCNVFVKDKRVKTLRKYASKEIIVVNFIINNHDGNWCYNIPIYLSFDGGCCPTKRRIDLRQLINNTMLCIEVDENQHKYRPKYDDFIRYNEILCDFTGKFIFIRYNPDKYKINNKYVETNIDDRLNELSSEVAKQIDRIQNYENQDMLEIIYLYYDK
jgi:hypothetical protein